MRAAPPDNWQPLEEAIPRNVFLAEVDAWARRIKVHPKVVQVRPMTRKWGSCSTAGRVSFDTSLLRQHAEFRKRVIVEELLHLRIHHHGKLFKAMLAAYLKRGALITSEQKWLYAYEPTGVPRPPDRHFVGGG